MANEWQDGPELKTALQREVEEELAQQLARRGDVAGVADDEDEDEGGAGEEPEGDDEFRSALTDRRSFLRRGAMGAGALWALSLSEFSARAAYGQVAGVSPYGPVSPKFDRTTGLPLLQLPDGFRYWSFGWTGDPMTDGVATPNLHDGMAVVARLAGSGRIILVRNHEGGSGTPYITDRPAMTYANDGAGGTTNIVFNQRTGRWEGAWSSLAGTVRNCAGGATPWGSWITCEETDVAGHGWNFDVGPVYGDTRPLKAMGRFSHEALMVDPKTGAVYQTEDSNDAGFYKFVPYEKGRLVLGGKLFMMRVKGEPNLDLGLSYPIGTTWEVNWVRIEDPEAETLSVYRQGFLKGGARFRRLEGAWWGQRKGYFLSTDGGTNREGQVFEYDPRRETITLIYDSPDFMECDNPDNMTVTPRGGLLLCEDSAGGQGSLEGERLIGLTLEGQGFTFGVNNVSLASDYNTRVRAGSYITQEFAGACYSPDGQWLFCNIQTPGITFAITGPWGRGPL